MPLRSKIDIGILAAAAVLVFVALLLYVRNSPSGGTDNRHINAFLQCETVQENVQRYDCYKDSALSSLQSGGNMEELSQDALEFRQHNRRHLMGHAIARAVLITSHYNLALTAEKCLANCITGYWHGIAEEWGKHDPERTEEYTDFFSKLCNSGQAGNVDCTGHSMGHLFIVENKNLTESFALCDTLGNILFPECAFGVTHQYIIDTGDKDIFGVCASYGGKIQKACYETGSFLYARWMGNVRIEDRLELCKELGEKIPTDLNWCYNGVGNLLAGNKEVPPLELCNTAPDNLRQLCIQGLSSPKNLDL